MQSSIDCLGEYARWTVDLAAGNETIKSSEHGRHFSFAGFATTWLVSEHKLAPNGMSGEMCEDWDVMVRLTAVANGPRVKCVSWYERTTTPRKDDVCTARQRAARWALRLNDLATVSPQS